MATSPPSLQPQRYLLPHIKPETNLGDLPPWSALCEPFTVYLSEFTHHSDGLLVIIQHRQSLCISVKFLVYEAGKYFMFVTPCQVGDLSMHGKPHARNAAKVGGVCSMCVCSMCVYMWKVYYFHSFESSHRGVSWCSSCCMIILTWSSCGRQPIQWLQYEMEESV